MIEGITPPTSGEILYKGQPHNPAFKREAGIQFQSTALMDYLTVREVLELFSNFYPGTSNSEYLSQLAQQCSIDSFMDQPAAKLSGGQRQRVLLAVALVNNPEIIFLDEPTTGLDPQSRRNFWHLIESIKAQGKTVVLTTHYMDEAEHLCDQLLIVDSGKIIAEGTPKALLQEHFDHSFICLDQSAATREQLQTAGIAPENIEQQHRELILKASSVETSLQQLIAAGISVGSLQVRNPSLDDLFLKLTGHSLRE